MQSFVERILDALTRAGVEFIVVGGVSGWRAALSRGALSAQLHVVEAEDRDLRDRIVERPARAGDGNVTRAAEALGKQRQQMQRWMRRFQLPAADFGSEE